MHLGWLIRQPKATDPGHAPFVARQRAAIKARFGGARPKPPEPPAPVVPVNRALLK